MKKQILMMTLCAGLVLAGCTQPQPTQVGDMGKTNKPQAWIDAPLDESRLPLADYEIVFHITDAEEVMAGELRINDQVMAALPNPDPADKLVTLKYLWEPLTPGRYVLSVRAQNGAGTWGPLAESVVLIGEPTAAPGVEPTPTLAPTITLAPTETNTATAAPTETLAPTAGFTDINITPDLVYYGYCSPDEVLVSAKAVDPAGITAVVLFYRLRDANGTASAWLNSAMDPQGGDQYAKTVNMNTLTDQTGLDQTLGTFTLEVQMVIQNTLGGMTSSPVLGNVTVEYCRR